MGWAEREGQRYRVLTVLRFSCRERERERGGGGRRGGRGAERDSCGGKRGGGGGADRYTGQLLAVLRFSFQHRERERERERESARSKCYMVNSLV